MGKISRKFNWLLVLSVSVSVFISSFATTTYLIYLSEKSTHDKNLIQIKGLSNNIREYLNNAYTLNYQLSLNPLIIEQVSSADKDWDTRVSAYNAKYDTRSGFGPDSGPPFLVKMQKEYQYVDLIFVQDKNGDQTGRSYGRLGHRKDRWWFSEFIEKRDLSPFISKSYYSLTGNKPVTSIFHPVMDKGEFLGIIGMDIVFSDLQLNVETYLNTEDMYAVVVDAEGVIIAHPDKKVIGEIYNLTDLTRRVLKRDAGGRVVLDQKGNQITETADLDWPREIRDAVIAALKGQSGYVKNIVVAGVPSTLYYESVPLPSDKTGLENYGVLLIQGETAIVKTKTFILISTMLLILLTIALLFAVFRARFRKFILTPLQVLIDSMNSVDIDHFPVIELDTGDEFMDDVKLNRLKRIAAETFSVAGDTFHYLSDMEVENLSIRKGTLNGWERKMIENHVTMTQKILEHISFPGHIAKVPEYASMHHEKLDGSGYHRGLTGAEIPLQARIIAIADVFEALSAQERPYKKPMNLQEVLYILEDMKERNHIDPELYSLIAESGIGTMYFETVALSNQSENSG